MTVLFLYGTLLRPITLARRGGERPLRAPRDATLHGWRRGGLPGTPYPTLRRQRTGIVAGALHVAAAAAFRRLGVYEGPRYHPRRVVVTTGSGKSAAWIWIAAGGTNRPWKG